MQGKMSTPARWEPPSPVKSVKVLCVSLLVSAIIYVWSFTFTEKSDCDNCDKANHVFSMISITIILVKLLQIIWCYVTSFAMCQSVWLFIFIFKRYAFPNPLNASVALIQKPVNWLAEQINWLVSIWGHHWHLMG